MGREVSLILGIGIAKRKRASTTSVGLITTGWQSPFLSINGKIGVREFERSVAIICPIETENT